MAYTPKDRHEAELAEATTPEENSYEVILAEYMTDGKVDTAKVRAALTPEQLEIIEGVEESLRDIKAGKFYTMETSPNGSAWVIPCC